MTDAELIARLRDKQPVTQDFQHTLKCALMDAAADRIEALGKACTEWAEVSQSNYQRAKAAEAKLAKAVETLEYYAVEALPWEADDSLRARATLAEIKGGNDAKSDL